MNSNQTQASCEDPAFLRSFGKKLSRGFNDAINGFTEDGWLSMDVDAPDNVIMSVKLTNDVGVSTTYDSIICVKASVLLQNVSPTKLVKLLNAHRSAWMNFNFDDHSAAVIRALSYAFPGVNTHNLSETAVTLGPTNNEDELLEVIRFGRFTRRKHAGPSGDLYHLQIINGVDGNCRGTCSELIFAPIARTIPSDAVLLTSGIRIISLRSNRAQLSSAYWTSDEASSSNDAFAPVSHQHLVLILAFQFPCETYLQEDITAMTLQYIQHVLSSIKYISQLAMSSGSSHAMHTADVDVPMEYYFSSSGSNYNANNLAVWICHSYRAALGVEMFGFNCQSNNSLLELVQNHPHAILCFSFTSPPVCLFANRSAVFMLDATPENLHILTVDQMLDSSNNMLLFSILPTVLQQGYAILPSGCCLSMTNRLCSYEQAVVWRVQRPDGSALCIAMALFNWSLD